MRAEHQGIPVTPEEQALAATESVAAGAGAIHVHVRAADGNESLAATDVAGTLIAIRAAVPGIPIGVSTGAWIIRDSDARLRAVTGWTLLPDFASVNFHEAGSKPLAELLRARAVGVEAGQSHESSCHACFMGLARPCGRSSTRQSRAATTSAWGSRTRSPCRTARRLPITRRSSPRRAGGSRRMAPAELVIASRRVATPDGIGPAAVEIAHGVITAVRAYGEPRDATRRLDLGDAVVLPGVVDTHVHVNEPGRTQWEGFVTATRAAA